MSAVVINEDLDLGITGHGLVIKLFRRMDNHDVIFESIGRFFYC